MRAVASLDLTPEAVRGGRGRPGGRRRSARPGWGWLAGAWATLFALVHLYWAAGGTVGLDVSAGSALAQERPA